MRRRRLLRRLAVTLIYTALTAAVAWCSLVPAALRAGVLRSTIEAKVGEALGFPVRIGRIDLPNVRLLIAQNVTLTPDTPGIGPFEVDTVRVAFRGPAPFGAIRQVQIDGVRGHVELSAERLREMARPKAAKTAPTGPPQRFRLAGPLAIPPIRAARIEIDGHVGGDPVRVRDAEVRIDPATPFVFPFSARGMLATSPDPEIDVRGALELTANSGRVRLDRLKIGTLAAKVGLEVPRDASASGSLAINSFSLPHAFVALLEALTGMKARGLLTTSCTFSIEENRLARLEFEGELADYEVSGEGVRLAHRKGRTRLSVAVAPHPDGGWRAAGSLSDLEVSLGAGAVLHFPQAAYETRVDGRRSIGTVRFTDVYFAQGDIESSKVAGEVAFDVTRDESNRVFSGSTRLTLTRAEFLKGELYQELDPNHALALTLAGRFDLDAADYQFKGTGLSIAGIGRLSLDGRVRRSPKGLVYDVTFETDDLAAGMLGERLSGAYSIDGLKMDGRVRAKARIVGEGADFTLDGRAFFTDLSVRKGNVSVEKLQGEVPLLLTRGPQSERTERGWVAFEDAVPAPRVSLGRRRLEVVARDNSVRLPDAFTFDLWGGRASVSDIALWNLMDDPRYELQFGVEDMDLERVAAACAIERRLEGRVSLPAGLVLVSAPQITVVNAARVAMFEGEIRLEHLRVLKPFDAIHRAYRTGFAMSGIRLREVCRTATEFGVIDGVAEATGQIELHTSGLPNWFQIQMRTVEKRGVEQVCDLQAVRALATILYGPDMGAQLARSPTDKLYYEKFGFYAAMDVDFTFYPRGLWWQAEGSHELIENHVEALRIGKRPAGRGLEFIMVGTRFNGLNINLANPGGGIDFNDIISRFKKVEKK